jgi:hypothetical protein
MAAQLKIKRSISNDIWAITFSLDIEKLSEADKELMRKFGEPTINAGGVILQNTPNEYTFPDKFIKVRADLPFTQEFDSKAGFFATNTKVKAEGYQNHFIEAYTEAFEELRSNADTFTGEYIENI